MVSSVIMQNSAHTVAVWSMVYAHSLKGSARAHCTIYLLTKNGFFVLDARETFRFIKYSYSNGNDNGIQFLFNEATGNREFPCRAIQCE